jgi:2-succinyl-5-enolpyruvyl-6-hydroxy-3-cyclohexene-1-carboxylate synthase
MSEPAAIQATFCATLVDEWVRGGVAHAVVSPGSRSTPLALALVEDGRLAVHVHHDERSAGFLALGIGLSSGRPAVVLTTSGTAAAELHPAVVEADLAAVPMLVCTADRPAELRAVGAPQAIDQDHLFGRSARWFHDPGVADAVVAHRWRALAARAHAEATGTVPGPVHLNLPFREPLLGTAGSLPPGRPDGRPWAARPPGPGGPVVAPVSAGGLAGRRGVVLAGGHSGDPEHVEAVAGALGWPVLADPRAGARRPSAVVVAHGDALLRSTEAATALRPEVVLRLGDLPASRVVGEWVAASGAEEVVAAGPGRWLDPHGTASVVVDGTAGAVVAAWAEHLVDEVAGPVDRGAWLERWRRADAAVGSALADVLAGADGPTEPGVARAVLAGLPDAARLVVASSMPIRDLEWYAPPRAGVEVLANRGANGIDGVTSTAVGVALATGGPTALLIGDVAFLHDVNGLLGAAGRAIDLVVVVVDNDGGGIFSFLPQVDAVPDARFEQLFGTPHGLDLVAVASAHGVPARAVATEAELATALEGAVSEGGVRVLVVRTDRQANLALHQRLSEAAARATSTAVEGPPSP